MTIADIGVPSLNIPPWVAVHALVRDHIRAKMRRHVFHSRPHLERAVGGPFSGKFDISITNQRQGISPLVWATLGPGS